MEQAYVVVDPYHAYAVRFIEWIKETYGIRPLLVYTSARERFFKEREFPALGRVDAIRRDVVSPSELPTWADDVRRQCKPIGVVPYSELTVELCARIAELLAIDWNTVAVLNRFRDKFVMKEHLRAALPSLRLNASRLVESAKDVFAKELPERFVIKPVAGYASRDIGFFSPDERERVSAYFSSKRPGTFLLEEFVGGDEFSINGQVDERGEALVYSMSRYEKRALNGHAFLYHRTLHVHQNTAVFADLESYAKQVLRGLGLVRSPFHMEVKVDERGPCLIEVGARLVGGSSAYVCNLGHDDKLDVFALAAHYYLHANAFGPVPLDWEHYNRLKRVNVIGAAEKTEVVYQLDGPAKVEALPEFRLWTKPLRIGERVYRTRDLLTAPYSVQLASTGELDALLAVSEEVRGLMRWNQAGGVLRRLGVSLGTFAARGRLRAAWRVSRGGRVP